MIFRCPRCGLEGVGGDIQPDPRSNASAKCWSLYCELQAYTLSRGRDPFIHQHAVDAYGAQHAIDGPSNIGSAFTTIGLYLALEKGFTGIDVQRAHAQLARMRKQWPELERPKEFAAVNIGDVMRAEPGNPRDEAIVRWAAAVWASWHHAREWVAGTCEELLEVRR